MAKNRTQSKLGMFIIAAVLLLFWGTVARAYAGDTDQKTITIAWGSSWNTIVPYSDSNGYYNGMTTLLYDRLAQIKEDGSLEPRAAESWDVSEDGKTYTFHLRREATWSDGTPVTSADWLFAAEFVTNPDVVAKNNYYSILEGTDEGGKLIEGETLGAEAPDDYTLVFHLKTAAFPEAFFGTNNPYLYALPKHVAEGIDIETWTENPIWQNPVTSGPFVLVSENAGQELVLEARKDYYLPLAFDRLIYKVMDSSNFVTSLLAGEIDGFNPNLTSEEAKSLEDESGIVIRKNIVDTALMYMTVNVQHVPKEIRQAISLAIDKETLVNVLIPDGGEPTSNLLNSTSAYNNPELTAQRDVEKAKQLVEESGWDTSTVLTMGVPAGLREKVAAIIQQNLAEVGITLELSTMDTTTAYAGMREGSIDCGLVSHPVVPGNPIFIQTQISPAYNNFANIKDDTYVGLLDQIRGELDDEKRIQEVWDLEALVVDESAIIPLFHQYNYISSSPRISGFTVENTEAPWEWTVTE